MQRELETGNEAILHQRRIGLVYELNKQKVTRASKVQENAANGTTPVNTSLLNP
jgi:hypothetical protein